MSEPQHYIPALGRQRLTPLYDPLLRWIMREQRFKRQLVEQAHITAGQHVLDLGCGTGTLTVLIKQLRPDAAVTGIDIDPAVLDIAQRKAAQAGLHMTFDHGSVVELPYPDASFEHVLSSLVFHHLTTDEKRRASGEVWRVLRSNGDLCLVDFGPPRSAWARFRAPLLRHLERVADNLQGSLPGGLRRAGFQTVNEIAHYTTLFGDLSLYRASKSGS
jgi:ubiquinone/menaquinone biosynthesis C-methylase UbiE